MEINPYSAEIRYTLDYMIFRLMNYHPNSIRVVTDSGVMAKSVIRRLPMTGLSVFVNSGEIQHLLKDDLGFQAELFSPGQNQADAALFPFSLKDQNQIYGEKWVVGSTFNAFSYKSLLRPGKTSEIAGRTMTILKARYQVKPEACLYSPMFIFYYMLARLVEFLSSSLYFQVESRAMNHLINYGWLWRFSYIVIFTGRSTAQG